MDFFSNDPAKVAQWIQGLINALLVALTAFGVIHWSDVQIVTFMAVVNILAGAAGALWVRRKTTPLAAPVTKEGVPLVPKTPLTRGLDNK